MSTAITDKHREFATAVVQAARRLGMNNIEMNFDGSGHAGWQDKGRDAYEKITLNWKEGRHGARDLIHLRYVATQNIHEEISDLQDAT